MYITCLDMEGVLVPEIWIAFAQASGIPELKRTTRDEPDYNKLMNWRLGVLKEHGLGLKEIQATIATIDPLPGAREFLDALREETQVIILSDTFEQFAKPLMKKLNWPTLFCNTLEVAPSGEITGFQMRCPQSKLTTVKALQSCGFETIAAGDSFNDLGMIQASKAGFLFRSTDQIKADYPQIPAYETYDELLAAIEQTQRALAFQTYAAQLLQVFVIAVRLKVFVVEVFDGFVVQQRVHRLGVGGRILRIRGAPELRAPLRELDGESDVAHQRHGCDGCKAPVKAHRQNAQHQQHFNQGGQDAVERIGHQ